MKCFRPTEKAKTAKRRPILFKVLACFVVLGALLVLLSSGLNFVFLRRYVITSRGQDLSHRAEYLARVMDEAGIEVDEGLSERALTQLEKLTESRLLLLSTDLIAYYRSASTGEMESQPLGEFIDLPELDAFRRVLSGTPYTGIIRLTFLKWNLLVSAHPLTDSSGNVRGAVVLFRPIREINAIVSNVASIGLLSALFAAVLTGFAAVLLSHVLTNPLRALNETALRMAEGHYDERFTLEQHDEIGDLGGTLNLLSSRLSTVIGDLQDEKSRLEQIISGIGEGILAFDCAGSLVHLNAAALEVLELPSWPEEPEKDSDHHLRELLEMVSCALIQGQRREADWTTAGTGRAIRASVWPIVGADNRLVSAVALVRDVSEFQRLEQLRRDYVANISHELRTPLTGIRGMVEPLMDGLMETEQEKQDCYQVIYDETLRLQKMIAEMLDISRLQDGRVVIETEPMQVEGVLNAAIRRMAERAAQAKVDLHVEFSSPLPLILGSEDHILQVLIILLDNALCFTPAGGSVTVYAHVCEDGRMCVGVSDTGSGIDPKDLPYIFERFYKADRARVQSQGTGLGLPIAKLTLQHMGGSIEVHSQPGKGATFEFFLPLAAPTPEVPIH